MGEKGGHWAMMSIRLGFSAATEQKKPTQLNTGQASFDMSEIFTC